MKIVSSFLLILLLGSACLGSISFVKATSQTNSVATSATEIQPTYEGYGIIYPEEVDYWWISNVNEGDLVLLSIQAETSIWAWESQLYYSNLTEIETIYKEDTHIYSFIANVTDDYLLRLYTTSPTVDYTIECTHQPLEVPMHTDLGIIYPEEVDYWWISNVNEGDLVLLSIQAETSIWAWESQLYYSNLTKVFPRIYKSDTHIYEFFANKTDNYLLRLYTTSPTVDYVIECTHQVSKVGEPKATETRLSIEPNPAVVGQTVSLLGNLTTSEGAPIPDEMIIVKLNGTSVATLKTNSTGWFKASGRVGSAGTFNITVEYAGSPQYLPSSDSEILVVNKAQTSIYAIFIPNPVNFGESCELRGILVDQFSNPVRFATVTLEYSTDYGLTWNPAGTLTTNSYGIFSKTFKAPSPRTIIVRISYAGSPSYESSTADIPLIVL